MIRKILGVIAAYFVFAASAVALFQLSGYQPHQPQPRIFELITALYGLFFSFLAGVLLQFISRSRNLGINYVLAAIMIVFAAFSMGTSTGSHWTQWLTILCFSPASIIGGSMYLRRNNL